MNILNSKWVSLACCVLNAVIAIQSFLSGQTNMFVVCTVFAAWCGYNFAQKLETK